MWRAVSLGISHSRHPQHLCNPLPVNPPCAKAYSRRPRPFHRRSGLDLRRNALLAEAGANLILIRPLWPLSRASHAPPFALARTESHIHTHIYLKVRKQWDPMRLAVRSSVRKTEIEKNKRDFLRRAFDILRIHLYVCSVCTSSLTKKT